MTKFLVWDEFNSSRESALEIEEDDAECAAIEYAKADVDGGIDGLYSGEGGREIHNLATDGQPICVADGDVTLVFNVGIIEFEPVFGAEQMPPKEQKH